MNDGRERVPCCAMYNNNGYDPSSTSSQGHIVLLFKSVTDIVKFQHECACTDLYMTRDSLTLVGAFTGEHLEIAINKYSAFCKIDNQDY